MVLPNEHAQRPPHSKGWSRQEPPGTWIVSVLLWCLLCFFPLTLLSPYHTYISPKRSRHAAQVWPVSHPFSWPQRSTGLGMTVNPTTPQCNTGVEFLFHLFVKRKHLSVGASEKIRYKVRVFRTNVLPGRQPTWSQSTLSTAEWRDIWEPKWQGNERADCSMGNAGAQGPKSNWADSTSGGQETMSEDDMQSILEPAPEELRILFLMLLSV